MEGVNKYLSFSIQISVLPEHPVVLNQWGQQLNSSKLGPKEEGDDIVLNCRVVGGKFIFENL